ncbi:MAG: TetR/AcrR family transcriptional regulator [Actinomycetes bacterium]
MTTQPAQLDRRQRRRQETISEVVDTAAEIMVEQGVAGLSLGEVARRMGIRPPSLYVYFPSKHALYDALFAQGAELVLAHMKGQAATIETAGSLREALLTASESFVSWSVQNPAYTQLLFWRPVPGFTPSAEAYSPAVELVELTHQMFADLQQRGLLRTDVQLDNVERDWTVLISGVISQQLSNAPHETFSRGRFTSALPELTSMFASYYGSTTSTRSPTAKKAARKESHRDRQS